MCWGQLIFYAYNLTLVCLNVCKLTIHLHRWIHKLTSWKYATSEVLKSWWALIIESWKIDIILSFWHWFIYWYRWKVKQIFPTSVLATTVRQSSFLELSNTLLPLIYGPQVVLWQNLCLDRWFLVLHVIWLVLVKTLADDLSKRVECKTANFSRRKWSRPTCWDNQGPVTLAIQILD